MTIGTVDELEAQPPGTEVVVTSQALGRQAWLRTTTGWTKDGTTVPSAVFEGALREKKVVRADLMLPPEWTWWHDVAGLWNAVVVQVDEAAGTCQIARFNNQEGWRGFYDGLTRTSFGDDAVWRRTEKVEPWMLAAQGLLVEHLAATRHHLDLVTEVAQLRAQVTALERIPTPVSEVLDVSEFARELRLYARRNNIRLENTTRADGMGALMRRFHLPTEPEDQRYLVRATGRVRQNIPANRVRELVSPLPDNVTFGDGSAEGTVSFPYAVEFRVGADDPSFVSRSSVLVKVREMLPDRVLRTMDFEVTEVEVADPPEKEQK
jgi:hypothetical protein